MSEYQYYQDKERRSMKCLHCPGTLEQTRISYTVSRKGYHLIIDDVLAWVCQQCGEPMFDEATVDAIQAILADLDERLEKLTSLPMAA
jgi:YgiT-type zinc finger domain-containing protein